MILSGVLIGCADSRVHFEEIPAHIVTVTRGPDASDARVQDLSGHVVSLKNLRGRAILLNFWSTWCATCKEEMAALQNLHDALKDRGFSVVGISLDDDKDALQRFVSEHDLKFPVFRDAYGEARQRYKALSLPKTFLIDPHGKLVYFSDTISGSPILSVSGPRRWDHPETVGQIASLVGSM